MSYEHAQVNVWASVELGMDTVTKAVADLDDADLIDFVLALDARVGELAWTVRLRDRLNEVIAGEQAPKTGGAS